MTNLRASVIIQQYKLQYVNAEMRSADPGGRLLAGIAGSNPARGLDVCLL